MTPLAGWRAGERSGLSAGSEKGNGWGREGSGENGDLSGSKAVMNPTLSDSPLT